MDVHIARLYILHIGVACSRFRFVRPCLLLTERVFFSRVVPDHSSVDRVPEGSIHVDGEGVRHPDEQIYEERVVDVFRHLRTPPPPPGSDPNTRKQEK